MLILASSLGRTLSGFDNTAHTLRGHSAVNDGNGNIYVFEGMDVYGGVRKELFILDTKQPGENWTLRLVSMAPEGRVFHTATIASRQYDTDYVGYVCLIH